MKKTLLLILGLMMAQLAISQTVVVLELPDPCSGTGVEEWNADASALSFDVYPNPVDDGITLAVAASGRGLGKLAVELTDMSGRVLLKRDFYSAHERLQTQMALDKLEAGVYMITLRCAEGVASKKLIKK